jgi:hypothetical protein
MLLAGEEVAFGNPQEAMAAGVGVVHQERNVVREFTVGENIVLSALPRKGGRVEWRRVWAEAKRCLDMLDLNIDPRTPMSELSAAQMQLVEIARGLYRSAQVLLLDEPTASLSKDEAARTSVDPGSRSSEIGSRGQSVDDDRRLALKLRGHTAERCGEVLRIAGTARGLLGLCLLSSWACGRIGYETISAVTADAAPKVDAGTPGTGGIPGNVGGRGGTTPPDAQSPMDATSDQVTLPPSDAGILLDANASDTARDAPQDTTPVDAVACPAICNAGCAAGTCKIVDPGDGPLSCPPGMPCEIWCGDAQCSRGLIACGAATRCDIHCTGTSSCGYQLACGTGPCTIECSGSASCTAVSCGSAPSCNVNCAAASSCWTTVLCAASKCAVRCGVDTSCRGGVDCSTACACQTNCAPGGCTQGRWTHTCPSTSCQNPDDSCNDTGAGCNTCP